MKVNFGSKSMLYPYPVNIIGVEVEGKLNYMQVGFSGIVNVNPSMISFGIGKNHYTTKGLSKGVIFSSNIADEKLIIKADYVGIRSGEKVDKSKVFETFQGKNKATLITEAPVGLECKVLEVLDLGGADYIIIAEILETYVDEEVIVDQFPNMAKMKPLLFSMYDNKYYGVGEYLGKGWSIGLEYEKK